MAGLLLAAPARAEPDDPASTAYQSALEALQQQQWTEAELWLERTLMYQPSHAEALVQLALLLAQRGQRESAQALIQALLQDPRTPQAHRVRLQALLLADAIAPSAAPAKPRGQLALTTGFSSNPMGISSASDLTLTLPTGDLTLPLQNRPSTASQTAVSMQQHWPGGGHLAASFSSSAAPQAQPAWRFAASLPLPPVSAAPAPLQPPLQLQLSASRGLDGASRQALGAQWPAAGLQWRAGYYQEPSAKRQGWYLSALAAAHNPARTLWSQSWLSYEHAQATASPAVRAGLTLQAQINSSMLVQWQTQLQQDTRGYSPLLSQNAKRQQTTSLLSLTHTWPRTGKGSWQTTAYLQRRWSNLPLFAWQDHGVNIAYTTAW
jgi:hypothetical protein